MADTDPKSSTNTPTPTPSSPKKKKEEKQSKKKSTPPKETTTDTPKNKQPTDIATPQPADKCIIELWSGMLADRFGEVVCGRSCWGGWLVGPRVEDCQSITGTDPRPL
ncbi:hypothetical protein PGT21_050166 [Puccinia graminis f. sp. tritici]|uniref:Uncharacterized protein n=1 Tax=Puccinia graminis f. sp. tritici TaxID=56615 RepID=A0A5B0QNC6_PUCGR|nr:hypothetical protein PGT21_050166 [Puccinia graminis f. sp. tritici]